MSDQTQKSSPAWSAVHLEFPNGRDQPPIFTKGSFRSLPLYALEGRAVGDIPKFKSGTVRIFLRDPEYGCKIDGDPAVIVKDVVNKPEIGIRIAKTWLSHVHLFSYFIQFAEDQTQEKLHDLSRHTEIVSLISDCLLAIDTTVLWKVFDSLLKIELAYSKHRNDDERDVHYEQHLKALELARGEYESHSLESHRVIERVQRTLEAWKSLRGGAIVAERRAEPHKPGLKGAIAFVSYAHQDDQYRIELEKHLSTLRHDGAIETWSDKCIVAGQEWEKEIFDALEKSDLVLLLISPDFLNSDFCFRREFQRALERHRNGTSVVVPIILRHCDWKSTPVVQFQALPTGARPIKSWDDPDEAFNDVVQGLRSVLSRLSTINEKNSSEGAGAT